MLCFSAWFYCMTCCFIFSWCKPLVGSTFLSLLGPYFLRNYFRWPLVCHWNTFVFEYKTVRILIGISVLCYFFDFFRFQGLQFGYCRCKYVYIKSNSDPYCKFFMCLNTDARFLIYFYHHFIFTHTRYKIQDTRSFILRRLHITNNISYKSYFPTNIV